MAPAQPAAPAGSQATASQPTPQAQDDFRVLIREPWGGIYSRKDVVPIPDRTGTRRLLKTSAGPTTIITRPDGYVLQFPNSTAILTRQPDGSLKVRFGPNLYVFTQTPERFEVKLPGDTVQYQLTYGRLTAIRSGAGSVEIWTNFQARTYTIDGPAGRTRIQLTPRGKGFEVTLLEGPPLEQQSYLVQGYRFEDSQAGVGLFIAVPGGALTRALGWSSAHIVRPPVAAAPILTPERERDPLDALPPLPGNPLKALNTPNWHEDLLDAHYPGPGERPLDLREAPPGEDHLKANAGQAGEDPLHLKTQSELKSGQNPTGAATTQPLDPAAQDLIVKPGDVVPMEIPGASPTPGSR